MTDMGERIASLETDMENVKQSEKVLFKKLDRFGVWLVVGSASAVCSLLSVIGAIVLHKVGLL